MPESRFFETFWEKRYCHSQRVERPRNSCFTFDKFSEVLFDSKISQSHFFLNAESDERSRTFSEHHEDFFLRIKKLDKPPKVDELVEICKSKYTLVVNSVHLYDRSMRAFINQLNQYFGERVVANAYFTPPNCSSIATHYDAQELFVLQVCGSKRWELHRELEPYPIESPPAVSQGPPPQCLIDTISMHIGDVLYLPRGQWHYPATHNEPSLHFTITVAPRIGLDFTQWLLDKISRDELFRQNLNLDLPQRNNLVGQPTRLTEARTRLINLITDKQIETEFKNQSAKAAFIRSNETAAK